MTTTLKELVLKDFWLKFFSLAAASLIWLLVHFTQIGTLGNSSALGGAPQGRVKLTNLPVVVLSSAEDVRSFHVNPKEVDVTVQGDKKLLATLDKRDVHVLVDLTGVQAAHDLRARIEVSTPPGITHVRVDPEEVQVIFPARN